MGQAKGEMKGEMFLKSLLNSRESRRMRGTLIAAATMTVLAGCSTYDSVTQRFAQHITPYRITVVQGNFVSAEAASQMKVGLTRDQVKTLFRLVRRPGLKRSHSGNREVGLGGRARVYS